MPSPHRETTVTLPIGYTDGAGQTYRQAVLRKMTGHEEALLYDPALNAAQLVTELLQRCLLRLGDLVPVPADVIDELYSADRNYLLLELRRFTLGDALQASYQCPSCGTEALVNEDLSQIPVRRLPEGESLADIHVELEDGYQDRDGALHTDLVLTLPRGADERFVAPMVDKDPLKARDALLLRCIKRFGSLPRPALEGYGVKILRDLTLGDRRLIDQALNGQTPGVDLSRQVRCPGCGRAYTATLDTTHFFMLDW